MKTLIVRACYTLLPALLFSFGLSWSLYMVFKTPEPLKSALSGSGIYSSLVDSFIKDKAQAAGEDLPLEETGIQAAVQKAFPPQVIEAKANSLIDQGYRWVQGDSEQLSFTVNLDAERADLNTYIQQYAASRAASLPLCTAAQLQAFGSIDAIDPFTAPCRPAFISVDAIAQQAGQQAAQSTELADATTVNADSVRNDQGQTLSQQLAVVPRAYSWTIWTMYASGIAAILCMVAVVALRRTDWRRTVKHLGRVLFSTGLTSVVLAWLIGFGLTKATQSLSEKAATSDLLQTKLVAVIADLAGQVRGWWMGYGITLIVLAILGFVVRKVIREVPLDASGTTDTQRSVAPPSGALHHE